MIYPASRSSTIGAMYDMEKGIKERISMENTMFGRIYILYISEMMMKMMMMVTATLSARMELQP
jgi:hypothetical protein